MKTFKKTVLSVFALALTAIGQLAWAGPVGTDFVVDNEARAATLSRIETLLATDSVAKELARYGVEQTVIVDRLNAMTSAELLALEGRVDELAAGEGVLGLVGAVFVVLLILELVGVIDVFSKV
jgi:hypothetical protein